MRMIFAQYYSGPKMKSSTDNCFLDNINGTCICLTAAILRHSVRSWQICICIDNVAFTRATSEGKKNTRYWQVAKVSGSSDSLGIQTPLKAASSQVG